MMKLITFLLVIILFTPSVFAFKVYSYNSRGERVYYQITPEIAKKNKSRPRRSYIRQPRTNWEITDSMRLSRKRTTSQFTHRY